MTLYFTPFATPSRRRLMNYYAKELEQPESMQCDVNFPINVTSENDGFRLTVLLPGVKADDLNIQVVNETVSIQGEFTTGSEAKEGYLLKEIPSGRFSRVLTLPAPLDAEKVEANLENGVLDLWVPKAEYAKPRTIKVIHNN